MLNIYTHTHPQYYNLRVFGLCTFFFFLDIFLLETKKSRSTAKASLIKPKIGMIGELGQSSLISNFLNLVDKFEWVTTLKAMWETKFEVDRED